MAIKQEWTDAAKSTLAGGGACLIAQLSISTGITLGLAAGAGTGVAQILGANLSSSFCVATGLVTTAVVGGLGVWGACKLFGKAPSKWIAGTSLAAVLAIQMMMPTDVSENNRVDLNVAIQNKLAVQNLDPSNDVSSVSEGQIRIKDRDDQALESGVAVSKNDIKTFFIDGEKMVVECNYYENVYPSYIAKTSYGNVMRIDALQELPPAPDPRAVLRTFVDPSSGRFEGADVLVASDVKEALGTICESSDKQAMMHAVQYIQSFMKNRKGLEL